MELIKSGFRYMITSQIAGASVKVKTHVDGALDSCLSTKDVAKLKVSEIFCSSFTGKITPMQQLLSNVFLAFLTSKLNLCNNQLETFYLVPYLSKTRHPLGYEIALPPKPKQPLSSVTWNVYVSYMYIYNLLYVYIFKLFTCMHIILHRDNDYEYCWYRQTWFRNANMPHENHHGVGVKISTI